MSEESGRDRLPEVSGRAMMIYRSAFRKHDEKRFNQYLYPKALDGKEKIHAETLYPYDLVESSVWTSMESGIEAQ